MYHIDPVHLRVAELNYELAIRGVDVQGLTLRNKTQSLRELLKSEEIGEHTVIQSRVDALDHAAELEVCQSCLAEITDVLTSAAGVDARAECGSRLEHVARRLKRLRPGSPENQTLVYELLASADALLAEILDQSRERTVPSRRDSSPSQRSPLHEILETIAAGRAAGLEERNAQSGSRPAPLNKAAAPFVPISGRRSSGNLDDAQFRESSAARDDDSRYASRDADRGLNRSASRNASHEADRDLDRNASRDSTVDALRDLLRDLRESRDDLARNREREREAERNRRCDFDMRDLEDIVSLLSDRRQHQREGSARKTVPVHQWKVSFSGEPSGMNLHDFLAELQLLQRSESVSDDNLFRSVVHLLTGRARLWYRSCFDTLRCWRDFVEAIRAEFLPPNSDYHLLSEIQKRKQKNAETFAEYISVMRTMFRYLTNGISEQHKLYIVQENMLQKYAIAVAAVEVVSIDDLSRVCRRVDLAYSRAPPAMAPVNTTYSARDRTRNVCEVGVMPHYSISEARTPQIESAAPTLMSSHAPTERAAPQQEVAAIGTNATARKCFNCKKIGHMFAYCPAPRTGNFCYRCGQSNTQTANCTNCAKNGRRGAVQVGTAAAPAPQ